MIKVNSRGRFGALWCVTLVLTMTACAGVGGQPEPGLWPDPEPRQSDTCPDTAIKTQDLFEHADPRRCQRLDWSPTHVRGWVMTTRTSSYSMEWTRSDTQVTSVVFNSREVVRHTWDWRTGRGTVTGTLHEVRLETRVRADDGCTITETIRDETDVVKTIESDHPTLAVGGSPLHFTTTTAVLPGSRSIHSHQLTQRPLSPRTPGLRCDGSSHSRKYGEIINVTHWAQAVGRGVITHETDRSVTVTGNTTQTEPFSARIVGAWTISDEKSWRLTVDKIK